MQGTVTLSAAAPAATIVTLASSNASATVPASVTVAAGASSGTFTVNTTAVSATTTATISAALNGCHAYGITNNQPGDCSATTAAARY